MTFILTNDDGIDAPGIWALWTAMGQQGTVVAPHAPHSGCSHQVTTAKPILIERRSEVAWAIAGTPADCTRLALSHLCPNTEWVLSGINAGGNLGIDVYLSGTVAAVREAAFHGIPGIAISHYIKRGMAIDWALASRLTAQVLDKLMSHPLPPGGFWNVNLPHLEATSPVPDLIFCPLCLEPLPNQYRLEGESAHYAGEYGKRPRTPGSDVDVCFSGHIAVTQLQV